MNSLIVRIKNSVLLILKATNLNNDANEETKMLKTRLKRLIKNREARNIDADEGDQGEKENIEPTRSISAYICVIS